MAHFSETTRCFSDTKSRLEGLRGRFIEAPHESRPEYLYWNLSCPFEWSKYSCAHQEGDQANISQFVHYEADGCDLPVFDPVVFADSLADRRLIFVGDSLSRQVSISLSCMLYGAGLVERYEVGWPACAPQNNASDSELEDWVSATFLSKSQIERKAQLRAQKRARAAREDGIKHGSRSLLGVPGWPCHQTVNCVPCGEHSGFNEYSVYLKNGGVIHSFVGLGFHYYGHNTRHELTFNSTDMVVVESLRHDGLTRFKENFGIFFVHQRALPHFIWLPAWPSFFKTVNGSYDTFSLAMRGKDRSQRHCRESVPFDPAQERIFAEIRNWTIESDASGQPVVSRSSRKVEFHEGPQSKVGKGIVAERAGLPQLSRRFEGILRLEGVETLGNYTVGSGVGVHGDCLHLCQPGPPDQMARALSWMLIAIGEEDGAGQGGRGSGPEEVARRRLQAHSIPSAYPLLGLVVLVAMIAGMSVAVARLKR